MKVTLASLLLIFSSTIFHLSAPFSSAEADEEKFGSHNIGAHIGPHRRRPFGRPGTLGTPIAGIENNADANLDEKITHSAGARDSVSHWPELVGLTGTDALNKVQIQRPDVKIVIVPNGSMVTADFRMDRVRIYVDESGKVTRPPRVG